MNVLMLFFPEFLFEFIGRTGLASLGTTLGKMTERAM
jgi:hypothetical protein